MIAFYPVEGIPIIKPHDNLPEILSDCLRSQNFSIDDGDILVVCHKIVSRAEGNVIDLNTITPSDFALRFAKNYEIATEKINTSIKIDPRKIEVILQQSKSIVRMNDTLLITENLLGFVSANSGVDSSNTDSNTVITHPTDPDLSAQQLCERILRDYKKHIGVIISDTFGRPLRIGTTNIAIGVAGMSPLEDFRNRVDLFGYTLRNTIVARADEIASASGLIVGQANEKIPAVMVKGCNWLLTKQKVTAKDLIRKREDALFW